jgi:hypothetical protein
MAEPRFELKKLESKDYDYKTTFALHGSKFGFKNRGKENERETDDNMKKCETDGYQKTE